MFNSRIVGVNPYYLVPPIQLGSGYPEAELFRGLRHQRGSGALTSFLAAVARKLIPYAKSYVIPHATSAAKGFVQDLVDGKNIEVEGVVGQKNVRIGLNKTEKIKKAVKNALKRVAKIKSSV